VILPIFVSKLKLHCHKHTIEDNFIIILEEILSFYTFLLLILPRMRFDSKQVDGGIIAMLKANMGY